MDFSGLKSKCEAVLSASGVILDERAMKVYRKEMADLISEIGPIPPGGNVADLAVMIATVQSVKDRVSEIANDAQSSFVLMDRICDLIEETASTASQQSSVDKRKAEAALLAEEYTVKRALSESFHKHCVGVLRNLDSKHDAISRIITCIQMVANGISFHGRSGASPAVGVNDSNREKWNAMKSPSSDDENNPGKYVF